MKKFVSLLLTGALACALLAGCGGGNTASPSPSASAPAQASSSARSTAMILFMPCPPFQHHQFAFFCASMRSARSVR